MREEMNGMREMLNAGSNERREMANAGKSEGLLYFNVVQFKYLYFLLFGPITTPHNHVYKLTSPPKRLIITNMFFIVFCLPVTE